MYKKRLHGVTCLKRVTGDNEKGEATMQIDKGEFSGGTKVGEKERN